MNILANNKACLFSMQVDHLDDNIEDLKHQLNATQTEKVLYEKQVKLLENAFAFVWLNLTIHRGNFYHLSTSLFNC